MSALEPLREGRERFYLTFGTRGLSDGYVVVDAASYDEARAWVVETYGQRWSNLYGQAGWDEMGEDVARYWPRGAHGQVKV